MRVGHVEVFVEDLEASRAFYRDGLGCEVTVEQPGRVVWLRSGETELLLRKGLAVRPAAQSYSDATHALVFYTDDLPATVARLESMGIAQKGCDGRDCCPTFQDPDGHWIQIVDPADQ